MASSLLLILTSFLLIHCHCDHFVDPKLLDVPEIHRLEALVNNSYLIQHSFLRCFENGDFANMTEAAGIFALNHYVYSKNFIHYLQMVADKIDDAEVSRPILENINEELGNYEQDDIDTLNRIGINESWYNHIPHQYLSQRFFESLGISANDIPVIHASTNQAADEYMCQANHSSPGEIFTKYMIHLYRTSNACQSLAIIGFAIEETVSGLYEYIWNGLRRHTQLTGDQMVFFPLHILIDDGHADLLKLGFKHYLIHNRSMCENADEIIRDVLDRRTQMYDEIRREIEAKQGYSCKIPYDHHAVDSYVDTASAVQEARIETLRYNALGDDDTWTLREKMSLSARVLAKQGHGATLSGQITCRNDTDGGDMITMLVNAYGKPFELVKPDDFLTIDGDLRVLQGNGFANKATRFHFHVYKKRADIRCIVHTHPLATSALSMTGHKLFISHMDTMAFYEDVQYLSTWPGIPFGDDEGDIISGLLSDGYWSALLSHHGLIVGGRDIEEATYRAYFFERAAKMQLDALSAVGGDMKRLQRTNPELSGKAREWRISRGPVRAHFNGWAQIIMQENAPF